MLPLEKPDRVEGTTQSDISHLPRRIYQAPQLWHRLRGLRVWVPAQWPNALISTRVSAAAPPGEALADGVAGGTSGLLGVGAGLTFGS